MNSLTKKLIDFGLTEKEAKVYLATLELEVASVNEIAKHSGINRSSTYVVLESLKKRGLVGISDDKSVRQYVAASPDTLLHTAKAAARKQEEIKSDIEEIVPELKALHRDTKIKPRVRVFEGKDGIREVFYDIFNHPKSDFRTFANAAKLLGFFPELVQYNQKRSDMGIKMRAINPAAKEMIEFMKKQKHPLPEGDELIIIPEDKFKFPSNVGIYGNKVTFISMDGNFGIIIESKEISDTLKNAFDITWEKAKELDKVMKKKYFK